MKQQRISVKKTWRLLILTARAFCFGLLSSCDADHDGAKRRSNNDAPEAQPLWSQQTRWLVCETPTVRIGEIDGPVSNTFGFVVAAVALADSTIAIADGRAGEVRFFGAHGNHLRTVGGKGNGPGEFQALSNMVRTRSDTLIVADFAVPRLTILDAQGEYRRSVPVPLPIRILAAVNDTLILVERRATVRRSSGLTRGVTDVSTLSLRTGAMRRIGSFPGPEEIVRFTLGGLKSRPAPFARQTYASAGSSVIYVGVSDTDAIVAYAPDGTRTTMIPAAREIRRVPADGAKRYFKAVYPDLPPERYGGRVGYPDLAPSSMPAFAGLLVDAEGYLWIRRYLPPWVAAPASWDVHRHDGSLLGTIDIPGERIVGPYERGLLDVGSNYILTLSIDSFGVERVAKYPLLKSQRTCE